MSGGIADGELQRKIEEYQGRERIYLAGLIGQEAQLNQLRTMAADVLGAYGDVSRAAVRGGMADPTANMEVLLLRQQAREKDQQISSLREELQANRFDQKTAPGQALMRKCKVLLDENRELGAEMQEDRMLRAALQAEKALNDQLRTKCVEASEFCKEIAIENDQLQGTIAKVAGKLRDSRSELEVLKRERAEAKAKRKREREQQKAAAAEAADGQEEAEDGAASPPAAEPAAAAPAPGPEPASFWGPAPAAGGPEAVPAAAAPAAEKPEKEKKDKKKHKKQKTEKE